MIRPPSLPDLGVLVCDASEYSRRYTREYLRAASLKRIHEVVGRRETSGRCCSRSSRTSSFWTSSMPNLDTRRLPLSRAEKHVHAGDHRPDVTAPRRR